MSFHYVAQELSWKDIVKTLFMFPYTVSVMFICIISGRLWNENKKDREPKLPIWCG